MDNLQEIRSYATTLGLVHTKNELEKLIHSAETEGASYVAFMQNVLGSEIRYRQDKVKEKRICSLYIFILLPFLISYIKFYLF